MKNTKEIFDADAFFSEISDKKETEVSISEEKEADFSSFFEEKELYFEEEINEEEEENAEPSEDEERLQERIEADKEYKESLMQYSEDDPRWMFQRNLINTNYLPCKVEHRVKKEVSPDEFAKEAVEACYFESKSGAKKLDQRKFCIMWHEAFGYIYAGFVLTPDGMIAPDVFRSEIVKMLFNMNTETFNIDMTAEHIYKTYISAYKIDAYDEPYKIPFRNGDLYLNKDKKGFTFYEGEKSAVPYRFNYDFHNIPNCIEPDFPNFRKWKSDLFTEEDQYTLQQMLGYLLLPTNEAQEAFFVVGKAGTGKSILTDCVIPRMLGEASFPVSIGQFFSDKFQVGTSEGKLCIIDDDIGEARLSNEDSGRFKNFVTAKTIKIEHKYCAPVKVANSARIVCAGNHMINSADKTDGFTRRLHPIYVKSREILEVDRKLSDKVASEIEMIVLWALQGILDMYAASGVPYWSENTKEELVDYRESQKWEERFISDCFEYDPKSITYIGDIKTVFAEWAKDNADLIETPDNSLPKYTYIRKWLMNEGCSKYGFVYKRGLKNGDNYNARGFLNMKIKDSVDVSGKPVVFTDETGKLKIRLGKNTKNKDVVAEDGER